MKRTVPLIVLGLLLASAAASAASLEEVLRTVRAKPGDLSLRPELVEEPHQLKIVLSMMRKPETSLKKSRDTATRHLVAGPWQNLSYFMGRLWLTGALRPLRPPKLAPAERLAYAASRTQGRLDEALKPFSEDRLAELTEELRVSLTNGLPDPQRLKPGESWLARDMADLELAGEIPIGEVLAAARDLIEEIRWAAGNADGWGARREERLSGMFVIVGGTGTDVHDRAADVIIDPGGDDVYLDEALQADPGRVKIIIDLKGNDRYASKGFGSAGAGVLGIGVLADAAGDDVYISEDGSQGAGLFGFGLLWDKRGDDVYRARSFSQAAGAFGVGMLIDDAGTDLYRASYLSQGMGFTRGAGLLKDRSGNDIYSSGFSEPDPRGYVERYGDFSQGEVFQSLSQGFGYGMRGMAGGGLGFLIDGRGNDQYLSDYFGQGSAYWYAWGMLYDGGGNDSYLSRRYSQGAGVHLAVGTLLDESGNDRYQSWGVSQGAGHDYAVGLLWDGAGGDAYVGDWSVMGLSNAKGVGMFLDQGGADRYAFALERGAESYWDDKRHGAGIGLFLDSGSDYNEFTVKKGTSAWNATRWGAGAAGAAALAPELTLKRFPDDPLRLESYKRFDQKEGRFLLARWRHAQGLGERTRLSETLYVASGWGLNTSVPMAAKRALLSERPASALPVLLDFIVPRNIFALLNLEEYFLSAPESRGGLEKLARSDDEKTRARAFYYLGKLRDPKSAPLFAAGLKDPSWRVRAAAARALGFLNDKEFHGRLKRVRDILASPTDDSEKAIADVLVEGKKFETLWTVRRSRTVRREEWSELADGIAQRNTVRPAAQGAARLLLRDAKLVEAAISETVSGKPLELAALRKAVSDPDPDVRRWAVHSLGQARSSPETLAEALGDENYAVREVTAAALAKIGEPALTSIKKTLEEPDPLRRAVALKALAGIKDPPGKPFIDHVLDPDPGVRLAALQGIAEGIRAGRWNRVPSMLERLSDDPDPWVSQLAERLLAREK